MSTQDTPSTCDKLNLDPFIKNQDSDGTVEIYPRTRSEPVEPWHRTSPTGARPRNGDPFEEPVEPGNHE